MSFDTFLKKHYTKDKTIHNYTKIKCDKHNVPGGSYSIPLDNIDDFYTMYKKHVFVNNKEAYFTEKQLELGPLLIDLDFRYHPDIINRQHTELQIIYLLQTIFEFISTIKTPTESTVNCFVFEKPNVNTSSEEVTKDGIHIVINVQMDFIEKAILRNKLLMIIESIFITSHIINTWGDVLDEGVMKGVVNWQLYGSRKPGHEAYQLKYYFKSFYKQNEWEIKQQVCPDNKFVIDNFEHIIARNRKLVVYKQSPAILAEYNLIKESKSSKTLLKVKTLSNKINESEPYLIKSENELDCYINDYYYNKPCNTENLITETIKETHEYAMILSDDYYRPGSYNNWIKVGMALRVCDHTLFASWLKLSSKSHTFDYSHINNMYNTWSGFKSDQGLTVRSIIYWAKQCDEEKFLQINNKSISNFIHYSFNNQTDYDIANVLYNCHKDGYICTSIKKDIWYEFEKHRWCENDSGISLRNKLSTSLFSKYNVYFSTQEKKTIDDDKRKQLNLEYTKLKRKLKTCSDKSNIMKEAKEIFFDNNFYKYLDSNPYLIGCANGIIDLKNKVFRNGTREDYISLSTLMNYTPLNIYKQDKPNVIAEINLFFEQLFPNEELRNYMWEHLASTLIGTNDNQTFNIYTGSGANGKSKLVDLMAKTLGDYKGTVPITLITQKRNTIGSTSSEVAQLIGKRYAVMQEPSKGDKINEGIMKEITGGDPIQCRALFKDSITFIPQFKLVVCTNTLFGIESNDDGTWRRIRVCEFVSKFTTRPNTSDNPNNNKEFPFEDYPYQFLIDDRIDAKFDYWAPVLFSMFVDIVYRTQGRVKDVSCVIEPTNKYRERQDPLLEFSRSMLKKMDVEDNNLPPLQISVIKDVFKQWCYNQYGTDKPLSTTKELTDFITKNYGRPTAKGWRTISLLSDIG